MAQDVYGGDNRGLGLFAVLLLPPLVPLFKVLEAAWNWLGAQGVHPMYQWAALAAEIAVILYVLRGFYRYAPVPVAGALTALYLGITYGLGVFTYSHDQTWAAGFAVATGIAGFFLGRALANEGHAFRAEDMAMREARR
jgi:hypothetical protein